MTKNKWYNKPDFNKLREVWYGKLKEEGFEDAERFDRRGNPHSGLVGHGNYSSAADCARNFTPEKQRFYELARQFYWYKVDQVPDEHLEVWGQFADGTAKHSVKVDGVSKRKTIQIIDTWTEEMLKFDWRHEDEDS